MPNHKSYLLLDEINFPSDLKKIKKSKLIMLCIEIREFLIASVNYSGGHFASSLGVVELTVALHYVFDVPKDKLVWDVGHQAYIHKILTGRKNLLHTIKKKNGLSAFPKISESKYDCFGVGHSSTSISAIMGMAYGDKILNKKKSHIAVIGDGAITAGMAFEAMNQLGEKKTNVLIILNDNNMSISKNVGGLKDHSVNYKKLANSCGLDYVGIHDGHNVLELINYFENIKIKNETSDGNSIFLHLKTIKGKGYSPAESCPLTYHHVSSGFNDEVDNSQYHKLEINKTFANIFGDWLYNKAQNDSRLVAITPAMSQGSDMIKFANNFPERFFDVGIAEQHSVTLAAGFAVSKLKPVVAIYSSFLQRAYDQVIHDVDLQNLDVLYAVDRAGLVGADGATHAGSFDISFMRCLVNTVVIAPSNENELYHLLEFGYNYNGPVCVRYPRGTGVNETITNKLDIFLGKGNIVNVGKKTVIFAFGTMLNPALEAGKKLNATVVDMRFIQPLDEFLLKDLSEKHENIITVEENTIKGGAGSAVNEFLLNNNLSNGKKIINMGLPDSYLAHGEHDEMLDDVLLSVNGIIKTVENINK